MKALVLEIRDGVAAALREDGVVVTTRQKCAVGETIELRADILDFPGTKENPANARRWLRTAAAAVLAFAVIGGSYTYTVAAACSYVSLDVEDAAVELAVNRLGRVIDVRALNGESAALAETLSAAVKNRPVEEAVGSAMSRLQEQGYLDDGETAVVAGVTDRNETRSATLTETVAQSAEREGVPVQTVETSAEDRRAAADRAMGAGRYAMEQRVPPPEEPEPPKYLPGSDDDDDDRRPETAFAPPSPPPEQQGGQTFTPPAPMESPEGGSFTPPSPMPMPSAPAARTGCRRRKIFPRKNPDNALQIAENMVM